MRAAMTNNIYPHPRMILDLFAIPLLHKKKKDFFGERRKFKEHMLWDRLHSSNADMMQ